MDALSLLHIVFRKRKNKMAFWTVSHCQTNNFREKYVESLRQYIDVDIFGKCSGVECLRTEPDGCFTKFVVIILNVKKWLYNNRLISDKDHIIGFIWPLRIAIVPIISLKSYGECLT